MAAGPTTAMFHPVVIHGTAPTQITIADPGPASSIGGHKRTAFNALVAEIGQVVLAQTELVAAGPAVAVVDTLAAVLGVEEEDLENKT